MFHYSVSICFVFEMRSPYIAQVGLKCPPPLPSRVLAL